MTIDTVRFCEDNTMNAFLPILVLAAVAASTASDDSFAQQMLDLHNQYRMLHGVANLTLDSDLVTYAQEWANYLSNNTLLEYRDEELDSSDGIGENIFLSPMDATAQEICADWYEEGEDYPSFTAEPDMSSFADGEFTQMVWSSTEKLGCGKATNSSGAVYVVCNYSPEGNFVGEFLSNVFAPTN